MEMPVWLTEFLCMTGNATLNAKFLEAAVPILEAAEGLERHAWFADRWETTGSIYKGVTLFNNADNRLSGESTKVALSLHRTRTYEVRTCAQW